MRVQVFKKSLLTKVVIFIITAQFFLSPVPLRADVCSRSSLRARPALTTDGGIVTELTKGDGGDTPVDKLIKNLRDSLQNPSKRAEMLKEINEIGPEVKNFLDIFLIKNEGRIDDEQLAALRSRLLKKSFPEISPKRIAVFGSNNVARLAIREIVGDEYDNLELVAAIGESAKDLFPFIIRDSHHGSFPGRAEVKEDAGFFYLGNQNEAIKVLSTKDSINIIDDFPWEALALDVVLMDEKMYKNVGEKGVKELNGKGIQMVVSRVAGDGFITYIPGMSDQAKIQEESQIRVASTQETAVGLALQGLSKLGEIKFGDVHIVQSQYGPVPPSYRKKSAYQTTHTEESLFRDVLKEAGIEPERFTLTSVVKTQIPRGEAVEVTVGVDGDASKEQVIECFRGLAEGSDILALPEEGVALSSNVIWGEKRVFFEPNIVYVNPYPGGTEIKVLFLIDENTAHVAQILSAISGKPSQELVKAEVEEEAEEPYAESEILTGLAYRTGVFKRGQAKKKAEETAEKIQAIKDAKTSILEAPGYSWSRETSAVQLLLAEKEKELLGRFEILYQDNKPVGIYVYNPQKNTLIASSLLIPSSLEETQETALKYYSELRNAALLASMADEGADIEVIDVYKPEEKLRTKFVVSAARRSREKTLFKSVEHFIEGEWITLAEPDVWLDPRDFKSRYTVAINAPGGRIGSLAMKEMAEERKLRILAAGGPTAEQLADFLKEGDTVQGPFKGKINHGRDWIEMDGKRTIILSNRVDDTFRNPANFPWISFLLAGIPVDVALDATGQFLTEDALNLHREAGALRAWPTAPGKGDEFKQSTFVMNVNEGNYDPDKHFTGSNASCTTGCLSMIDMVAELAFALHRENPFSTARIDQDDFINAKKEIKREMMKEKFGQFSLYGLMVTLHALTGEILGPDVVSAMKKATRKRGAGGNIIPTTTGAAAAIGLADLAQTELDGFAIRFPTDVGSLVIANYILEGVFTREEFVAAAELVEEITTDGVKLINVDDSGRIKMLEEYKKMMAVISPDKIQVINFINDRGAPTSMVKISGWYENEAYYAHEVVKFINEVMRPKENRQLQLAMDSKGSIIAGEQSYDGGTEMAGASKRGEFDGGMVAKKDVEQFQEMVGEIARIASERYPALSPKLSFRIDSIVPVQLLWKELSYIANVRKNVIKTKHYRMAQEDIKKLFKKANEMDKGQIKSILSTRGYSLSKDWRRKFDGGREEETMTIGRKERDSILKIHGEGKRNIRDVAERAGISIPKAIEWCDLLGLDYATYDGGVEQSQKEVDEIDAVQLLADYDGGNLVRTLDDLGGVVSENGIKSGFFATDLNDSRDKSGALTSDSKIGNSLISLVEAVEFEGVEDIFVLTHSGRADGRYIKNLSLGVIVERVKKFLDFAAEEKGFQTKLGEVVKLTKVAREDIVVELLPYDLEEAKQKVDEVRRQNKGKKIIFVIENIRFYSAETAEDDSGARSAFEQELINLTGKKTEELFYISEAFEKSHRGSQASMELVNLIPLENRAAGRGLEENIKIIRKFEDLAEGRLSYLSCGSKFDKFKQMAVAAPIVKERGGVMFILGALSNPALDHEGYEIGASLMPKKEKDIAAVRDGWRKIKNSGVNFVLPKDFWALKGEEPARVKVLKKGEDEKGMLRKDQSQYEIGPESLSQVIQYIKSSKEGDALIVNGVVGIIEEERGRAGTFAVIRAASDFAEKGGVVLFAGADINRAVDLYEKTTKQKVSSKALYSRGGGVVLRALNEGIMNLSPIVALIDTETEAGGLAFADGGIAEEWRKVTEAVAEQTFNSLWLSLSGPDRKILSSCSKDMEITPGVAKNIHKIIREKGFKHGNLLYKTSIGKKVDSFIFRAQGEEIFNDFLIAVKNQDSSLRRNLEKKAIILSPNVFKAGGVIAALKKVNAILGGEITIALYGKEGKAESLKDLLGIDSIVIGDTLDAVRMQLAELNFQSENIVLLRSDGDTSAEGIRQIIANNIGTLSIAKTLSELLSLSDVKEPFREYCVKIMAEGIISQEVYNENIGELFLVLEATPFTIPDVELTEEIAEKVEIARATIGEFMDQI